MRKHVLTTVVSILALGSVIAPVAARANDWNGVDPSVFVRLNANGTATLTPAEILFDRNTLQPYCTNIALETTPTKLRSIGGRALTTGIIGGASNAGGTAAEAAVLGSHLAPMALPAVGLFGLIGNALFGGLQANQQENDRRWSAYQGCLARYAGGLLQVGRREQDAILAAGQPVQVGWSRNWTKVNSGMSANRSGVPQAFAPARSAPLPMVQPQAPVQQFTPHQRPSYDPEDAPPPVPEGAYDNGN